MKTLVIVALVFTFFVVGCFIYYAWIEPAIFRSILNRFENGGNEWPKDSGPKGSKKE